MPIPLHLQEHTWVRTPISNCSQCAPQIQGWKGMQAAGRAQSCTLQTPFEDEGNDTTVGSERRPHCSCHHLLLAAPILRSAPGPRVLLPQLLLIRSADASFRPPFLYGDAMEARRPVCLVTGGRGFLARHLVSQLLQAGTWSVRIADLGADIALSEEELGGPLDHALRNGLAHYTSLDVRNRAQVFQACKDVRAVFHTAAPSSCIDDRALHFDVTVLGTRNVIEACQACGVKTLVYTSSPSVVMDANGRTPLVNADESLPFAQEFQDVYAEAKAQAEAAVLQANGRHGVLTCALRPFGIFGPGDRLALPSLVAGARSWKMKFVLGDGENLFDWTYVENVAHAHLCAQRALASGEAGGKAYFITDARPQRFWGFVGDFLSAMGYERPKYKLPMKVLLPVAHVAAWLGRRTGISVGHFKPSRLRLVSGTWTFDISRARRELGYEPVVDMDEAMRRTVESFSHIRAGSPVATLPAASSPHAQSLLVHLDAIATTVRTALRSVMSLRDISHVWSLLVLLCIGNGFSVGPNVHWQ